MYVEGVCIAEVEVAPVDVVVPTPVAVVDWPVVVEFQNDALFVSVTSDFPLRPPRRVVPEVIVPTAPVA